ncbi:MAG: TolC family protein [Filimonas sp.]|nr:TolC family protein [Filimonas sp.]
MKNKIIYTILLSGLISWGCKVAKPVQIPDTVTPPEKFSATTDTTNIGLAPRKVFFKDKFLQSLIDTALQHNTDLLASLQRIEAARASLMVAKGNLYPSLNAVVSAGVDKYGNYTQNGVGNWDTNLSPNIDKDQHIPQPGVPDYMLGFRSSWEVDIWGKLKNKKAAALAKFIASENATQFLKTTIVANIAGAYYELLALDNELKIVEHNSTLQKAASEVVKVQKEGGRATQLAVQQFEAQLFETQSIEYNIRQEITATENYINLLMGRFAQPILRDTTFNQAILVKQMQTGVPSSLLLNRPDIREAEMQLHGAKADVKAARAAFFPSFTITPYAGLNAFSAALFFNVGSLAYGIVGSLTAPIFNNKQNQANYTGAIAQNKEAYYNYQRSIISSFNEVTTDISKIENTQKALTLREKQVTELKNAVGSAKDLYLAGYASYLEVITAQKSVLQAEIELNDKKKELFQTQISLYKSLGGGWRE